MKKRRSFTAFLLLLEAALLALVVLFWLCGYIIIEL